MDDVEPATVALAMVETGRRKLAPAPADILISSIPTGGVLRRAVDMTCKTTCKPPGPAGIMAPTGVPAE